MAHCPFILDLETHDTSFECGETGSVGEQGELASDKTDTNSPKVANFIPRRACVTGPGGGHVHSVYCPMLGSRRRMWGSRQAQKLRIEVGYRVCRTSNLFVESKNNA